MPSDSRWGLGQRAARPEQPASTRSDFRRESWVIVHAILERTQQPETSPELTRCTRRCPARRTHRRSGQCTLVSPPAEPSLGTRVVAALAQPAWHPGDLGRWWRAILGGDPPGRAACLAVHGGRSTPGMGGAHFPPTSSKIRPRPSLAHAQLLTFTQKPPMRMFVQVLGETARSSETECSVLGRASGCQVVLPHLGCTLGCDPRSHCHTWLFWRTPSASITS